MKRSVVATMVGIGLLALPASSLGGPERGAPDAHRGSRGHIVARDSAKKRPAAAVARVTMSDFGKVSFRITSNPKRLRIDWAYTVRCVKGSLIDYFPGPGDLRTTTKRTVISGHFPIPLADPDFCTFAVAGQIAKDGGHRVTTKIYNKG